MGLLQRGVNQVNKVVHFEIPADDLQRADKFYQDVFGWKIVPFPMEGGEYHMAYTVDVDETTHMPKEAGAINGGIIKREKSGQTPVLVIDVENIDEHLKKIESNGGKVVSPKQQVADMGLYANVTDTEGNIIGVWQDLH